jgi:hypothetical protein
MFELFATEDDLKCVKRLAESADALLGRLARLGACRMIGLSVFLAVVGYLLASLGSATFKDFRYSTLALTMWMFFVSISAALPEWGRPAIPVPSGAASPAASVDVAPPVAATGGVSPLPIAGTRANPEGVPRPMLCAMPSRIRLVGAYSGDLGIWGGPGAGLQFFLWPRQQHLDELGKL